MIDAFDSVVYDMMQMYGTSAFVVVNIKEEYDADTSENKVYTSEYRVNAMFFDYLDKNSGSGNEKNSLVQTGDKQVYIQPPHKTATGIPLPHIQPNKDRLRVGDKVYKIVALKEINPSMSRSGCVLYEAYVRE